MYLPCCISCHLFPYLWIYRQNTWASCPDGYLLRGFYYSNDTYLNNIEKATCCRPQNFKNIPLDCIVHNVNISFSGKWRKCEDWSYLAGLYKGDCDGLNCTDAFRCCRMPPPGNSLYLASDL